MLGKTAFRKFWYGPSLVITTATDQDRTYRLANLITPDPSRRVVVAQRPKSWHAQEFWTTVVDLLWGLGPVRLAVPHAGSAAPMPPAQWVANCLGVEVVAPDGTLTGIGDGMVAVTGGATGRWLSFCPGRPAVKLGRRYPEPGWEREFASEQLPLIVSKAAEQIPAGIWLRRWPDRSIDDEVRARVFEVPASVHVPTVVVGSPDEADFPLEEFAALRASVPMPRVRLLSYGQHPDIALGQALADRLGERVVIANGMPAPDDERPGSIWLHDSAGQPTWDPFAVELVYRPFDEPEVTRYQLPMHGPKPKELRPGVFAFTADIELEVIQSGLWLRGPGQHEGSGVRGKPADSSWVGLTIGVPGELPSDDLIGAANVLATCLDPAIRARLRPHVESTAQPENGSDSAPPPLDDQPNELMIPVATSAIDWFGTASTEYPSTPILLEDPAEAQPVDLPQSRPLAPRTVAAPPDVGTSGQTGPIPREHVVAATETEFPVQEESVPAEVGVAANASASSVGQAPAPMQPVHARSALVPVVTEWAPSAVEADMSGQPIIHTGRSVEPDRTETTERVDPPSQPEFERWADAPQLIREASSSAPADEVPRLASAVTPPLYPQIDPNHRATAEEHAWLRRHLGTRYERYANSIVKLTATAPALRQLADAPRDAVIADLVAVRGYLADGQSTWDAALRTGRLDALVPYLHCVTSGLRRLPSYRGVAFCCGLVDALGGVSVGDVVAERGIRQAVRSAAGELDGSTEFVLWSSSGRRLDVLEPEQQPSRVAFLPGSIFRVLDTGDPSQPVRRILLRQITVGAARDSLDESDIALRAKLADAAAERDEVDTSDRMPPPDSDAVRWWVTAG
jgi:hypothetical protein